MNVDLATQIRDYTREVHADERSLTLNEITDRRLGGEPVRPIGTLRRSAELRPRWRWRRWQPLAGPSRSPRKD